MFVQFPNQILKEQFVFLHCVLYYCNHEGNSVQKADKHSNGTHTAWRINTEKYLSQTPHTCSLRLPVIKAFCKTSEQYFSAERRCQDTDYNSICFGFKGERFNVTWPIYCFRELSKNIQRCKGCNSQTQERRELTSCSKALCIFKQQWSPLCRKAAVWRLETGNKPM